MAAKQPNEIGLGELIVTAAEEIRRARDEAAKKGDPVLKLENCEIELKVNVSAEAGAGIKVWILDVSGKGKVERASTIKLRFGPAGDRPQVFMVERGSMPTSPEGIVPARRAKVVEEK